MTAVLALVDWILVHVARSSHAVGSVAVIWHWLVTEKAQRLSRGSKSSGPLLSTHDARLGPAAVWLLQVASRLQDAGHPSAVRPVALLLVVDDTTQIER